MSFVEAISSGFSNYVNFSGRAPRSAYWYWVLFAVLLSIVTNVIDVMLFFQRGLRSAEHDRWAGIIPAGIVGGHPPIA